MKLRLDPDSLTFGDLEDFEDATGEKLLEAFTGAAEGELSAKALIGLVWICKRQDDLEFTLDDARKLKLAEIEFEAPEPDPTPGSA